MYKNILLPTDGLAKCLAGACHGILLAKALGAKITAVYVTRHLTAQEILETYHEDTTWGASDGMKVQEAIEQAEGSHREEADKALAVAERMCAENGVPCEKVQLEDESPADGILHVADQKGCDVIFLSTHGNPGIMGKLFGTLASKVMSHTKSAVLVHHCDGPG
ncbi:MAG: universal stress protein [Deltaproteobacteria bacterium]|nr:MAG: universal stress protein [Deltaproteobacteria bacterium]